MTTPEIWDFFEISRDPGNSRDLLKIIVINHLTEILEVLIPIQVKYATPNKYKSYIRLYKPLYSAFD